MNRLAHLIPPVRHRAKILHLSEVARLKAEIARLHAEISQLNDQLTIRSAEARRDRNIIAGIRALLQRGE